MSNTLRHWTQLLLLACLTLALAACGGGDDTTTAPVATDTPPTITSQPASVSVNVGDVATFTVVATGSGTLSYQWLRNGVALSDATAPAYTTAQATGGDDGTLFSVTVSNAAGSTTSTAARLGVAAAGVAPTISVAPASTTVNAGAPATFSVTVEGSAPLSYEWRRNGVPIAGANSTTYSTDATVIADSGSSFTVTASNAFGTVTSQAVSLTVTTATIPPAITTSPLDVSVIEGQVATFSVVANGTTPLGYQWHKNGVAIAGATAPSYSTGATALADDGSRFAVTVANPAGSITSVDAILTVAAAAGQAGDPDGPRSITVTVGDTATFSTSEAGFSYVWQRNGTVIAGANTFTYTTPPTVLADSGAAFIVRFVQQNGIVSYRSAVLNVTATPVAPSITAQPVSVSVPIGQRAVFQVAAIGTAPMSYQWRRNGIPISGANSEGYALDAVSAGDNGAVFTVVMTNSLGTLTSNPATLTATGTALVPPTIMTQPASILVNPGQTGDFHVVATGSAPLSYQWRKNGADIGGANGDTYFTPPNQMPDSGALYSVVVSNGASSVTSSSGTLTVTTQPLPPRIVTGPSSVTVNLGQTATFSLTAAGTPPFTFSWVKNNLPITGANAASYTTPPVGDADDGAQFYGGAGNSRGGAASPTATLNVTLPTSAVTQMVSGQYHSAVLKADGTVFSWGDNQSGVKGIGSPSSFYATHQPGGKPLRALNIDNSVFDGVVGIAAGTGHTVAVRSDGTVWGWGPNSNGQLADGSTGGCASSFGFRCNPVQAMNADATPFAGARQVAAGNSFTVALKADGTVWAWGSNQYGKLGDGSTSSRAHPVQVIDTTGAPLTGVSRIAAGLENTLALKTDRTVWAWGRDFGGPRAKRVDMANGQALADVVSIAVGGSSNVGSQALAVTADGRAWAWGNGNGGTLGNGSNNDSVTPTPVVDVSGVPIVGIATAAAGQQFSMLLKADGTVLAFGFNNIGQLGDNSYVNSSLNPVPVRDATGAVFDKVRQLVVGYQQSFVLRDDGTVWAWGLNDRHQIDVSANLSLRNPTPVPVRTP